MGGFLALIGTFTFFIGLVMLIVAIKKKKPKKKLAQITGAGFVILIIAGMILPPAEEAEAENPSTKKVAVDKQKEGKVEEPAIPEVTKEEKAKAKKEEVEKIEAEKAEKQKKELLNVKGTLKAKAEKNKITVYVDTNIPDGSLLEVSIVDGNINHKSGFIKVKDGHAELAFDIPSDWKPAHFAASAMFRFNLEDHPQPVEIINIYGETGAKMTGDLATENHLGGKNATFKTATVAYPSEEGVKQVQSNLFNEAIAELKSLSGGIIVDVLPRYDDWDSVNVVLSDSWYYSAEHEKERFADQIGEMIISMVNNAGKSEDFVSVYFVDSYGADLATPKILGGWKIKK